MTHCSLGMHITQWLKEDCIGCVSSREGLMPVNAQCTISGGERLRYYVFHNYNG